MKRLLPLLFGILLLFSVGESGRADSLASEGELYSGKEYSHAFAAPVDHAALPDVLLIGDSISIGYTVDVRKELKGKADIFRIPENGRYATYGLEKLEKWLGEKEWDVIHFNWGLWDLCYRNPESETQGHRDKVKGTLTTTPDEYGAALEKIVTRLKQTNAKLIWCATTPVPEFEEGRKVGDELVYNRIAAEIMAKNEIAINDLHSYASEKFGEIQKKKGDVHFTAEGYAYLAEKVSQSLSEHLPE